MTTDLRDHAASCGRTGCPIQVDGRCLEGFEDPRADCPHVVFSSPDDGMPLERSMDGSSDAAATQGGAKDGPPAEQLPSGDALSASEADSILAHRPARVVCMVADNDAGKTTLVATLFECFQNGPFAGYTFAGSATLIGFEKRCHDARLESGRPKADTVRTRQDEGLRFLHLRLASRRGVSSDLLLADRAGEGYKVIRDSDLALRDLVELGRADVVLFLVDRTRLLDADERMSTRYDVFTTVKAVLDAGVLRSTASLQLVLTKIDLGADDPRSAQADAAFAGLLEDIRRIAGPTTVDGARIASRPDDECMKQAYGLDALISVLLERRVPPARVARRVSSAVDRPFEAFDLTYDGPRP